MIPHSRPHVDDRFVYAVADVIRSAYLAEGEQCRQLEKTVQKRCGQNDAVAVDSGTSALMLALRALKQHDDIKKVGIPSYACTSLWYAVCAAGCTPVVMDCAESLRLDVDKAWDIAPALDAVILVHPFGMVEPLVAESWDCPVIEDIAQAAGATYQGKPLGSFGDVSVASFYATKPWGGAYGGMVMGKAGLCDAARQMSHPDSDGLHSGYVGHHQLSNVHAALALTRLQSADQEQQARRQHMQWLDTQLPDALRESVKLREQGSAFRYIIRCDEGVDDVIHRLHAQGIAAAKPVQRPLHGKGENMPEGAKQAWQACVSLPVLADMTMDEYTSYARGISICFSS